MPIRHANDKLFQAVSSVGGFGEDFGTASGDLLVVLIQVIDHHTCEPRTARTHRESIKRDTAHLLFTS